MDEEITAEVTVVLQSGRRERLVHVDAHEARRASKRYSDWAGLGGVSLTRDEWPDAVVFELANERGDEIVTPYAAIALVRVVEEPAR